MKKKILYFDYLNVLACIAVVFIHCNTVFHRFSNTNYWKSALLIQILFVFAVPTFVMLTGATLLEYKKKYDTRTYIKKRSKKILLPFIFWSFIYFVLYNKTLNLNLFILKFRNCDIEPIFWFFPMIIYMYILIPIFSKFTEEKNYCTLKYIFILIFIFGSVLSPLCNVFNSNYPDIFLRFNYRFEFVIYLILGFLLTKINIKKRNRIIIYISAFICIIINYTYTLHYSTILNATNEFLMNYICITNVIPSCAVFLFFKNINFNNIHINNIVSKLSTYSYGVYLIHFAFIIISWHDNFNITTSFYRLILPILLYFICILITFILKKMPIIKTIVP